MIKIRFVTGNDFISNAIRVGERDGWCTHVEAIMPEGTWLGAHLDGGVQARLADYDKITRTRELIIEIIAPNSNVEDKFNEFLRTQVGKPYDVKAVFGLGVGRNWRDANSWFCSELIAAALETCGYLPRLSVMDNHISPRDLLLVLSGRILIEGAT